MRRSGRRANTHPRPTEPARSALPDARASLVALALILLLGLAAFPLLTDGRVLDNLGAGLRSWAGAHR